MNVVIFLIFALIALLIIGSAVMVVATRNIVHSALWLISCFFGVGALYLLLEAEFVAAIQVLVYVGAVSILLLFAIMLTRQVATTSEQPYYQRWWISLLVSAGLFAGAIVPTVVGQPWRVVAPSPPFVPGQPTGIAGALEIGQAFMREYLIPFELASLLLLTALVGAIVIAYEERARRRRVLTLAEEHARRKQQAEAPVTAPTEEREAEAESVASS